MKRLLTMGGLVFAIAQSNAPVFAQAATSPTPLAALAAEGPRIQFADLVFDFGKVKPTDSLRHDFVFTNTGMATLELTEVRPACGCTTAAEWDRVVQPGKTGKIPIQFNPGSFHGAVSKSIIVNCNDAVQGMHTLHVKAQVFRPIEVQPMHAYFTVIEGETTNETKTIRIVSNLDEPLTLETPQSSHPSFQTELKTVRPGKEFNLLVTYDGTVSNATRPQGTITIQTSTTNAPTLSLTAYAMPQPALMVIPQRVQLPAGAAAANYRANIIVRNNGHTLIELSEPTVNEENVATQIQETQKGKAFTIILTFPPEFQSSAAKPLEFTVKTTHPKYPLLRVPIVPALSPVPLAPPSPPVNAAGAK